MAKKLQPDIVISDVVMPVMDGLSLCGKLRQDLETCHIPIILLTAQPSTGLSLESISQGADDYITKPFNISQLEARCRNLLENRQRMRRKYSRSIAGSEVVTTNDKDANFLTAATEAVERNLYKEDINVQTLCRELNVSKTILTQKIKGITGHSPGESERVFGRCGLPLQPVLQAIGIQHGSGPAFRHQIRRAAPRLGHPAP